MNRTNTYLDRLSYPRLITIASSSDIRNKINVTVNCAEDVLNLQRNRYEILGGLINE